LVQIEGVDTKENARAYLGKVSVSVGEEGLSGLSGHLGVGKQERKVVSDEEESFVGKPSGPVFMTRCHGT
jgi:ribosomal protein L35AE/L33A